MAAEKKGAEEDSKDSKDSKDSTWVRDVPAMGRTVCMTDRGNCEKFFDFFPELCRVFCSFHLSENVFAKSDVIRLTHLVFNVANSSNENEYDNNMLALLSADSKAHDKLKDIKPSKFVAAAVQRQDASFDDEEYNVGPKMHLVSFKE